MNEDVEMDSPQAMPAEGQEPDTLATTPADELDRLRGEAEDFRDKFLRCKADQQNAARRASSAQAEAVRYANAQLIRGLLPALDDFERLLSTEAASSVHQLTQGVRLIHDNLTKFLRDAEVTVIDTVGREFDPTVHEALMQQPSDRFAAGQVIQELQKGYRLHDRTLRPARVIVSSGPPPTP